MTMLNALDSGDDVYRLLVSRKEVESGFVRINDTKDTLIQLEEYIKIAKMWWNQAKITQTTQV